MGRASLFQTPVIIEGNNSSMCVWKRINTLKPSWVSGRKKKTTKPRVCREALDDNLGYCVTVAILVSFTSV